MTTEDSQKNLEVEFQNLDKIWAEANRMHQYMTKGNGPKDDETVANKFNWFQETYPRLYSSVYKEKNDFEMYRLKYMLDQKRRILREHTTEYQASVEVGEKLAERFLYPKTGRPDPSRSGI